MTEIAQRDMFRIPPAPALPATRSLGCRGASSASTSSTQTRQQGQRILRISRKSAIYAFAAGYAAPETMVGAATLIAPAAAPQRPGLPRLYMAP